MELTIKLSNKIMLLLLITIMSIFIIQPVLINNNNNVENNSSKDYSNNQFTGRFVTHFPVNIQSGNITPDCYSSPCGGGWV